MIDQTTTATVVPARLHLPMQAAPIDRSQSQASAVNADGGVEAALFGLPDWVGDIAKAAIPLIAGAVSDRRLKLDVVPVRWAR